MPTSLISPTPADSCSKTSGRYVCSSPTKTTPVLLQALHPLGSRLLGGLNASAAHPECCSPAGLQPVLTVHHSCTPRTGNQRLLPFKSLVLASNPGNGSGPPSDIKDMVKPHTSAGPPCSMTYAKALASPSPREGPKPLPNYISIGCRPGSTMVAQTPH